MTRAILALAAAALLAACDRNEPAPAAPQSPAPSSSAGASQSTSASDTTPANVGAPKSTEERREGANPTQQQVDPKEREQRRDFQHSGDDRGPTSTETKPRD